MISYIPLLESSATVFNISDIARLSNLQHPQSVRNFAYKLYSEGILHCPYRGIYAKKNYNIYELAVKIKTPSYISGDTVLYNNNIIFQVPNTIFAISNDSRVKYSADHIIEYHKIKDDILYNPLGIIPLNGVPTASPERALCDLIYLQKQIFHIDAPELLDKKKLEALKNVYDHKTQSFISQIIALC